MHHKSNIIESWEQRYLNQDTPWNKGKAAPPLVDFLAMNRIKGHVLVPGCGLGHDVRAIAQHGCKVLGVDIAPTAIDQAKTFASPGVSHFMKADFLNLPGHLHERFDWVIEHTLFCAIPLSERPRYVKSAHQALKKGGTLFAIFYLNPESNPGSFPFGSSIEELKSLFGTHFRLRDQWIPKRAYPGREGKELVQILEKF